MHTRAYRLITALEVTLWLIVLLLLGAVQPATPELTRIVPTDSFTASARLRHLDPQHLHRPLRLHRRTGESLPAAQFLK